MFNFARIKKCFSRKKRHDIHCSLIALLFLLSAVFPEFALAQSNDVGKILKQRLPGIFEIAKSKARMTIIDNPSNLFPITTNSSGKWKTTTSGGWTSGFFPGILWLLYEQSGNKSFQLEAVKRQDFLAKQQYNTKTHDVGFMVFESFGNAYRLTGNEKYRPIITNTARSLSSRYNQKISLIKSWDNSKSVHETIIDNLMNLQILFWSANNTGNKNYKEIATNHALKTAQDFVRPDGSTYHLVNYNPVTGKILSRMSAQGLSPKSSWARGQAWAIYGFTTAHKETGNPILLNTARKTANYFIKNLPGDFVPYWDFNAPNKKSTPRDSSAAAIAASGLIELAEIETSQASKNLYMNTAENILLSLSSKNYLSTKKEERNILLHGTYNKNTGDFDTGTIWGDYYFLQALLKYSALNK